MTFDSNAPCTEIKTTDQLARAFQQRKVVVDNEGDTFVMTANGLVMNDAEEVTSLCVALPAKAW